MATVVILNPIDKIGQNWLELTKQGQGKNVTI